MFVQTRTHAHTHTLILSLRKYSLFAISVHNVSTEFGLSDNKYYVRQTTYIFGKKNIFLVAFFQKELFSTLRLNCN